MVETKVELREICDVDNLKGISLGDKAFQPLKTFLERDAKKYHATDLAKTYALFQKRDGLGDKIIGYITLICADISVEDAPKVDADGVEFRHPSYPGVKIARLAVHKDFRFNINIPNCHHYGMTLVQFALGLVKQTICPAVGCRFVVVDAKRRSISFYERLGFTMLDTKSNRERPEPVLFIDMTKIAAA